MHRIPDFSLGTYPNPVVTVALSTRKTKAILLADRPTRSVLVHRLCHKLLMLCTRALQVPASSPCRITCCLSAKVPPPFRACVVLPGIYPLLYHLQPPGTSFLSTLSHIKTKGFSTQTKISYRSNIVTWMPLHCHPPPHTAPVRPSLVSTPRFPESL
jgi:hypothetical protein